MSSITILLPGLLASHTGFSKDDIPGLPAIEILLSRSSKKQFPQRSYYSNLFDLFNLQKTGSLDLPVAAVSRLIDGAERPDGIWMRADPVHLSAGRNGLMLTSPHRLGLTQHDAIILAATLEELFVQEGWSMEIPVADRWYLRLPEHPAINTSEIDLTTGREIQPYMPEGADRNRWAGLLTEIQMLLHDCEINLEREKRGLLPVNSLWFWGVGELPEIIPRQWAMVFSDEPVAQGLAMLSSTRYADLPERLSDVLLEESSKGDVLVCSNRLQNRFDDEPAAWLDAVQQLEDKWFGPALEAVRNQHLDELVIDTCNCLFTINRRSLLKFWRFRRTVFDYPGQ